MKSILSYNVNGIRAAANKSFWDWLKAESPDILCIQETKVQPDQLSAEHLNPDGYHAYWHSAEKKGYSGVALLTKEEPLKVSYGTGVPEMEAYDREGRILRADFEGYSVMSLYVPSGSSGDHRQEIKDAFMKDFYAYIQQLLKEIPNLIIAGDINICHTEIDIHDPKGNKKSSGFLPHERQWLSDFLDLGFVDAFRKVHPDAQDQYSWWSYRARSRSKNKGWRIDYHLLAESLSDRLVDASILSEVVHSDHCPIKVVMDL